MRWSFWKYIFSKNFIIRATNSPLSNKCILQMSCVSYLGREKIQNCRKLFWNSNNRIDREGKAGNHADDDSTPDGYPLYDNISICAIRTGCHQEYWFLKRKLEGRNLLILSDEKSKIISPMNDTILKLFNEGKQKVSCYSVVSVIVSLSKRGTCDHQILSQIRPWPIFLWFCILLVHGLKQIPNKNSTIGQPSTDFYDEVWHIGKENVRRRWVEASSGLKLCRKCRTQWVVGIADSNTE